MTGVFGLPRYLREPALANAHAQSVELSSLRIEKQESEVRLSVLQAQVEPHFLFNTLASVKGTIREDPALAESTIDALVDYLRSTIPMLRRDHERNESTLGLQVRLCERYLEVMRLRMGGRLSYRSELPSELHHVPFPPLLLISLVENAIKHGIEPKPGAGSISIQAVNNGGKLIVSIVDDGVGFDGADHRFHSGVGLSNVRQQLKTLYGSDARVELSSNGIGATAKLVLPFHGAPLNT